MTTFGQLFVPAPLLASVSDGAWVRRCSTPRPPWRVPRRKQGWCRPRRPQLSGRSAGPSSSTLRPWRRKAERRGTPRSRSSAPCARRSGASCGCGAPRRDEPGRRRHRRHARLAPRARPRPGGARPGGRGRRSARRRPSRDADGRAHASTAGRPDDVRAQGRRLARRDPRGAGRARTRASGRLAVQLGGAAGTLSALGDKGVDVLRLFARQLELAEPSCRGTRIACASRSSAGAVDDGGLAREDRARRDLARADRGGRGARGGGLGQGLLDDAAQAEPRLLGPRPSLRPTGDGPHRVLTASLEQEHQRAAGAWQAEWPALSGALLCTGGAAAAIADVARGSRGLPGADAGERRPCGWDRACRAGVFRARRPRSALLRRVRSSVS